MRSRAWTHPQFDSLTYYTLSQLEGHEYKPNYDTATPPKPTIGIGVNLAVVSNLDAVMDIMGIGDDETSVRSQIQSAVHTYQGSTAQLRNSLDAIMYQRSLSVPGTREQFAFSGPGEENAAYDVVLPSHEDDLDSNIPGVPDSYERAALLSLDFNGDLLGPNLIGAITIGDRAESRQPATTGAHVD